MTTSLNFNSAYATREINLMQVCFKFKESNECDGKFNHIQIIKNE